MIELNPCVIGEKLKRLREEKGLSHERLAKELQEKYGGGQDGKKPISIDSLKAYEVSRIEHSKIHDWKFWNEYLEPAIQWLIE